MSYVRIWVHSVWSTKNREPYLRKEIRGLIFRHIKTYANDKGYHVNFINGVSDHVHCLILLREGQDLSAAMTIIKGESSHWINKNRLTEERFSWQNEYYAVSTCVAQLKSLRLYIENQEEHHKDKEHNFEKELEKFNMTRVK